MFRIAGLVFLSSFALAPSFARSWSGVLVDAGCYQNEERNVNANDTTFDVDHDRDWEIRQCLPSAKTKEFVLVDHNGQSIKLDAAGNAKAEAMFANTGKKPRDHVSLRVTVSGEREKSDVKVESISPQP